jgi:hypothetical protein
MSQDQFKEIFARRIGCGGQITCLGSKESQPSVRLAVGTRNKGVQVFTFDHKKSIQPVFAVELDMTVPVSLGFVDNHRKDVYVFGLYNGYLYVLP